jgi:hypothetical protein
MPMPASIEKLPLVKDRPPLSPIGHGERKSENDLDCNLASYLKKKVK